jgi:ubiquinone/menaquinone biosynthesis C-methylase UbiE
MSEGKTKTRDEIAAAYRSPPWWYDVRGFLILTFAYNSTLGRQLRFFGPNFGPRHLEVACGTGTLLGMVLKWRRRRGLPPSHVIGVDYAESMLAGAQHRFAGRSDIELKNADAAKLPYPDNSFDTANIANALHCLPDVDGALRDIHRVLKPGGTFAANVLLYPQGPWPLKGIAHRLNDWGIRKGILVTPYHRDDIRARSVRAGFAVLKEGVSGNCYELLLRKHQKIQDTKGTKDTKAN